MIRGSTTAGNDRITGDEEAQRLEGAGGNDTLVGGGGADTLVGGNGNDRLIVRDASGTTGLRGGNGDDFLSATLRGSGQVHMFGMDGNDTLEMDLTKETDQFRQGDQVRYMGHHVYGGVGADTFSFINVDAARGVIIGRIDDFNIVEDRLLVDGRAVNLNRPGNALKIFEFLDQQWLKIGGNAYFALEGARAGGAERHFLDSDNLSAMLRASRGPELAFVDQVNEVPLPLYAGIADELNRSRFSGGNNDDFHGSSAGDLVHDVRVRSASTSESRTNNSFDGRAGRDVINAGKGDDTLRGGAGDDSLAGGIDDDLIFGQSGEDHLFGGSQNDRIYGGLGDDTLEGGTGDDTLRGQDADDLMRGGAGRDLLWGGDGDDKMGGGRNSDRMFGEAGMDTLYGGDGGDTLRGGAGRDTLWGGAGDDLLDGGSWNDKLYGQAGDDRLLGGQGQDTLRGGAGNDRIEGGKGRDRAIGDGGADTFVFRPDDLSAWDRLEGDAADRRAQLDLIADFELGRDSILLAGFANVDDLRDLRGTSVTFEGTDWVEVAIRQTDQRLLVHLEAGLDWSDLRSDAHFDFA